MKNNKFLVIAMAAFVLFTGCKENENEGVNKVTLDKSNATIEVGSTVKLTATVDPAGSATVTWESNKPTVATVSDDGVVTGVAEGTAFIIASAGSKTASCVVNVTKKGTNPGGDPDPSLHASLQGSEYYVIALDATSAAKIQSKIVASFYDNGTTNHFYIWPDTGDSYVAGESSGLNFYGEMEGWASLSVGTIGWSGFGYAIDDLDAYNKLSAIMAAPEDYYFHIAMKSTDQGVHLLAVNGTSGEGKFVIGGSAFVDNGVTYQPYQNISRDGEWNEIEIPMTYFLDKGVVFSAKNTKGNNLFWGLSGGTIGVNLQFDACFIYKK